MRRHDVPVGKARAEATPVSGKMLFRPFAQLTKGCRLEVVALLGVAEEAGVNKWIGKLDRFVIWRDTKRRKKKNLLENLKCIDGSIEIAGSGCRGPAATNFLNEAGTMAGRDQGRGCRRRGKIKILKRVFFFQFFFFFCAILISVRHLHVASLPFPGHRPRQDQPPSARST